VQTGTNERPGQPIALVIGGGGMGMSTARRLGQSHRVVLASQSAKKNTEREAALREDGIDAIAVRLDVTDPASVAELKEFVAAQGQLRTLAHVAGLSPSGGDWHELLLVNLIGTALMERACLELAVPGTAAVFVSSVAGHLAVPPSPEIVAVLDDPLAPDFFGRLDGLSAPQEQTPLQAYRLSKYALNRMCRRRAADWGARGARIVSMSPGTIATPMGARELDGPSREMKLNLMQKLPIAREGTMVETADAIEFLASDKAGLLHHRHGPACRRRDRGCDPVGLRIKEPHLVSR
jgi:NAD(P)-dependent dehydrogenase (short-subunit alcohol dehydrogenase family)